MCIWLGHLDRFDLGVYLIYVDFIYVIDMFLLFIYADRQCQAEIKMLYGNMVKIFNPDGDATIVMRRKEEVVWLDWNNIWLGAG